MIYFSVYQLGDIERVLGTNIILPSGYRSEIKFSDHLHNLVLIMLLNKITKGNWYIYMGDNFWA